MPIVGFKSKKKKIFFDNRFLDSEDRTKTKHYIFVFVHSFAQHVFVECLLLKMQRGILQVPALMEQEETRQIILQVSRKVQYYKRELWGATRMYEKEV